MFKTKEIPVKPTVTYRWLAALLAASLSCNFLTQGLPASVGSEAFSAEATSPASIHLEWQTVTGASGYKLEARYGTDFFPVADLPGDQTSYEHFVVPGSTDVTYRLSAGNEIGTVTVTMPALAPNPLVVQASLAGIPGAPGMEPGAFPTFDPNAYPTLDPTLFPNVDPSAFPTFDPNSIPGFDPDAFPGVDPSLLTPSVPGLDDESTPNPSTAPPFASLEVGPEGGTVTATGLDGVTYTLTLPEGAVDQITVVTLWPVQGVGGLPFSGGPLGAVQVWPQIPFNLPFTLSIKLPANALLDPAAQVVGFSVSSYSNELALHPVQVGDDRTYVIASEWGDTFGLAAATREEIRIQMTRIPADSSGKMNQLIAGLRASATESDSDALIYVQILEGLSQMIEQATVPETDDTRAVDGIRPISARLGIPAIGEMPLSRDAEFLEQSVRYTEGTWKYFHDLAADSTASAYLTRLISKIKAFVRQTELKCITEDALYVELLMNRIAAGHQMSYLRGTFWGALADSYGPLDTLRPCTFEFEVVTSTTKWEGPVALGTVTLDVAVHTPQPINLKLGYREKSMFLYGVGPVQYDKYTWTVPHCSPYDVKPYPRASLWIEELAVEFDEDGNLSDFVLRRVRGNALASLATITGTLFDRSGCKPNLSVASGDLADFWTDSFMRSVELYKPYDMWEIGGSPPFFTATNTEFRRIPTTFGTTSENISLRLSLFGPAE